MVNLEELYGINPQEFGKYDVKKAQSYMADREEFYSESVDKSLDEDDIEDIDSLIKHERPISG